MIMEYTDSVDCGSRLPQSTSEWKDGGNFQRTCSCDVFKTGYF